MSIMVADRAGEIIFLTIIALILQFPFGTTTHLNTLGADIICNRIPGLTEKQREMCRQAPDVMVAIGAGVRLGLLECQQLFKHERWNCTAIGWPQVFTHVVVIVTAQRIQSERLKYSAQRQLVVIADDLTIFLSSNSTIRTTIAIGLQASPEAALTYAISSSGVTYAVTAACSRGNISSCGCDPSHQQRREAAPRGWKWGGCSSDVNYGMQIARRFLDAREIEGDDRSLMNLHNNKAGRKAVKVNLKVECKCHGVSGSCTMRTCWETLPNFRKIGDRLMRKYKKARHVVAIQSGMIARSTSYSPRPLKLVLRRPRSIPANVSPKRSELVFLQGSPNYCERDLSSGSLGTVGRFCNRTSKETDGCDLLCCGRGYNTLQRTKTWQCRCRFQWCCSVNCDTCTERVEEYTCK